jgi:hypothetical protein
MPLFKPWAGFSPICSAVFAHKAHWAFVKKEILNNTKKQKIDIINLFIIKQS